ncbi:MAG TPA: hypothetical protein VFG83_12255 [Kofleriaceae bacterium]|nr:hypothetical protein [Kofleriaceae bacterium]
MNIEKFLDSSARVAIDDLDWDLCRKAGVTSDEIQCISYFADVESQTVFYMRELLATPVALTDPDMVTFATMWNYEEMFHSRALERLLAECGHALPSSRQTDVRQGAGIAGKLEVLFQTWMGRLWPDHFAALYVTWGASQELLTSSAYDEMARRTANPVLRELCMRIGKQERRHFAWYFGSAKKRLADSRSARKTTRFIIERLWSPVGGGVKSPAQARELVDTLWGPARFAEVAAAIDARMATLPGMDNFSVVSRYAASTAAPPSPRLFVSDVAVDHVAL